VKERNLLKNRRRTADKLLASGLPRESHEVKKTPIPRKKASWFVFLKEPPSEQKEVPSISGPRRLRGSRAILTAPLDPFTRTVLRKRIFEGKESDRFWESEESAKSAPYSGDG